MADDPIDPEWLLEQRAEREARRAERRRQVRRRRIAALVSLVGVVVAVGIVVAIASGGGSGGSGKSDAGKAAGSHSKNVSDSSGKTQGEIEGEGGKVRNATPQPDWGPHTGPVPILEYHVIGEAPESEEYLELSVSRPYFRHQLEWLDENGYQAV